MEARVVFVPCGGMHAGAVHEARRSGKWAEVEAAEAFRVDDLLDFSNDEIAGPIGGDEFQVSDQSADSCVTVAEEQAGHNSTSEKQKDQIPNALEAEDLCVACDDIAELEWLSTFVEDSFSADKFLKPALASALLGGSTPKHTPSLPVPGRARSKRSRASVRVWSSRLLSSNSCRSLESASHQSFYSFGSPETGFLSPDEWGDEFLHVAKKPNKILRRKTWQDAAVPRRCSHCLTQRTPQWRAGPLGAKTLCNACGVRFKSGRLLPEYRPAGSPTFVSHQHSNSHRKVLEMRKQKTQPQVEEVEVSTRDQAPQKSSSEELNTQ